MGLGSHPCLLGFLIIPPFLYNLILLKWLIIISLKRQGKGLSSSLQPQYWVHCGCSENELNYLCGWTFLSSTKYWPLPFHGTGGFELDELVILALFSYTTDWLWKPVYSSLIQWVIVLWVQPSHSIWGDLLRFLVCLHPHAHTQLKVFLILWTEIRPLKFPSFPIYYVEKKYIV